MQIVYNNELSLSPAEFVDVLVRSTLSERRPVSQPKIIKGMIEHASILVTARHDGKLVGISRAISDFSYCTYLSDLAVDRDYQGKGIGKELIKQTHKIAGSETSLILLAAPKAATYYPHIGMRKHDSCWLTDRD
ncbi:MAG: GNAT family N-acetyltransferase [Oligoflexales bacterium]